MGPGLPGRRGGGTGRGSTKEPKQEANWTTHVKPKFSRSQTSATRTGPWETGCIASPLTAYAPCTGGVGAPQGLPGMRRRSWESVERRGWRSGDPHQRREPFRPDVSQHGVCGRWSQMEHTAGQGEQPCLTHCHLERCCSWARQQTQGDTGLCSKPPKGSIIYKSLSCSSEEGTRSFTEIQKCQPPAR